ncbi:MAG: hypothetical protein Q9227_009447 [Pyrenula ochraceoflavens]
MEDMSSFEEVRDNEVAMPLDAVRAVSTGRNGLGAFILQCKRLDFHYCDSAGSSRGMNAFLKSPSFVAFSKANPQIEILVSPRPRRHPVIKGQYINGQEKAICVKNLEAKEILQKARYLSEASGELAKKIRGKNVVSTNESVRGIWSPYHGGIKDI